MRERAFGVDRMMRRRFGAKTYLGSVPLSRCGGSRESKTTYGRYGLKAAVPVFLGSGVQMSTGATHGVW